MSFVSCLMEIKLTRGYVTLVDYVDWVYLKQYKWRASSITRTNKTVYAIREEWGGGRDKRKTILMHRFIMKAEKGVFIDHRDGVGLNNTRTNLRTSTTSQNCSNVRKRLEKSGRKVTSKYKGVHYSKPNNKWVASIRFKRKLIHIGSFENELEAAKAYDSKSFELFCEFAKLNFNTDTI